MSRQRVLLALALVFAIGAGAALTFVLLLKR
jgi:hypothetical protein